jgi:hypothetical protein
MHHSDITMRTPFECLGVLIVECCQYPRRNSAVVFLAVTESLVHSVPSTVHKIGSGRVNRGGPTIMSGDFPSRILSLAAVFF